MWDCAAPAGSVIDAAAASCGWVYQADRCLVCHQHSDLREPDAWDHLGEGLPVRVTAPPANLGSHPAIRPQVCPVRGSCPRSSRGACGTQAHAARLRAQRCARSSRIHSACPEYTIADDVIVLAGTYCPPDLFGQLLADHRSFPHAATPHRQRHDQEERAGRSRAASVFLRRNSRENRYREKARAAGAACRRQHPRA